MVIPGCDENVLPYLRGQKTDIFDTQGLIRESEMSNLVENERRLFYVALTRARKGVLIGMSESPSRFIREIQLQQTEALMEAVTWLHSGGKSAQSELLHSLQKDGANGETLRNLTGGYLPDLGFSDLAAQIQNDWTIPVTSTEVHPVS